MNADDFRKLALSMPETEEAEHMGHPDFRVRNKIFATLTEDESLGMVKLTPAEQASFIDDEPKVFRPVKGAWGKRGCTHVVLRAAQEQTVRQALILAWRNTAPKRLAQQFDE